MVMKTCLWGEKLDKMPNGMKTNWRIQGNAFVGMAAVQGDRGRAGIMTAGSKKDVG